VISNYSFFLALMGLENIRNDICYPGLKVRLIGTHSGIAMGFYGTSHHCNEDIGALRATAGLVLMAPCDGQAIRAAFTNTIHCSWVRWWTTKSDGSRWKATRLSLNRHSLPN
jgi:transketolase